MGANHAAPRLAKSRLMRFSDLDDVSTKSAAAIASGATAGSTYVSICVLDMEKSTITARANEHERTSGSASNAASWSGPFFWGCLRAALTASLRAKGRASDQGNRPAMTVTMYRHQNAARVFVCPCSRPRFSYMRKTLRKSHLVASPTATNQGAVTANSISAPLKGCRLCHQNLIVCHFGLRATSARAEPAENKIKAAGPLLRTANPSMA